MQKILQNVSSLNVYGSGKRFQCFVVNKLERRISEYRLGKVYSKQVNNNIYISLNIEILYAHTIEIIIKVNFPQY
jgi:hypothetical protein